MSISWDKTNKRWRFAWEHSAPGIRRKRVSRLLPQGWSKAEADSYDRREGGRLYTLATGGQQTDPLISEAVTLYLADKAGLKSFHSAAGHLAAIAWAFTERRMSELPEVARKVSGNRVTTPATAERPAREVSDATVRNRLALLKAACRWAWKAHGLTQHDPTGRMQLPTVRNERHVYATREQVGKLAWAADRRDLRALILLAFYTGMRLGELQRAEAVGGALVLQDTKNGDRRAVPVHPHAKRLLAWVPFAAPKITLQRAFQRARAAAGLPHIHLHDLRHSAASEMINAGVDLYTVGAVLGHRDARSTKRYSHLRHDTLADAVSKIGRKIPHNEPERAKKKAA